jgi:hypothetical protein
MNSTLGGLVAGAARPARAATGAPVFACPDRVVRGSGRFGPGAFTGDQARAGVPF